MGNCTSSDNPALLCEDCEVLVDGMVGGVEVELTEEEDLPSEEFELWEELIA